MFGLTNIFICKDTANKSMDVKARAATFLSRFLVKSTVRAAVSRRVISIVGCFFDFLRRCENVV